MRVREDLLLLRVGPECTKIARFSAAAAAILTAPQKIARFFEAPRCAISSAKKTASEPRFLLRMKWVKMVLAAEFPAIPSAAKSLANGDARFWCTQGGTSAERNCPKKSSIRKRKVAQNT